MSLLFSLLFFIIISTDSQTIKQLREITINEELSIGSVVTFLTDKIPNLDQSLEYDLVTPLSVDLDLFSIDHTRHTLNIKKRLDFEQICSSDPCIISVSIAVSNHDTIDVYILPIRIRNLDDNPMNFPVNRTVIEIEENDANWFRKSYPLPHAIDADGDLITYSLFLQNWKPPTGLFELNSTTLSIQPLKEFDREEQSLYLLRLVAHNKHEKDISLDVIVVIKDLNDNAPRCEQNSTLFSIDQIQSNSTFTINATDPDEGDNGKFEFHFSEPYPGFSIDAATGQIQFDYSQWKETNQSKLFVNITDFGKTTRLSTECEIELKFLFLFRIQMQSNYDNDNFLNIENIHLPIGRLLIEDQHEQKACFNCVIQLNLSFEDLFILNNQTMDISLNLNSNVLTRILSNNLIRHENLPLTMNINVWKSTNPSIISSKTYSLTLKFDKEQLLSHSNILFLRIEENFSLNETIPLSIRRNSCSKELRLIDPTNTFAIDKQHNLVIQKYLNLNQQQNYQLLLKAIQDNQTDDQINQCSFEVRIQVYHAYSISNVYPYFSQTFHILTSNNLSQFVLPLLPSHVKYVSSKSHEISVDERNASITIQSSSLSSTYEYDFQIQAIDSKTPSLSCSIAVRILFGMNKQAPRLLENLTKEAMDISSGGFLYQIKAYDPDLSLVNQKKIFPPSIEYELEPSTDLDIERYTGRVFVKSISQSIYNLTLILTDFGQPNRLSIRQRILFEIKLNTKLNRQEIPLMNSTRVILISTGIIAIIILLIILLLLFNCCRSETSTKKSLVNLSPTTPDTRLIDNEYITTATSLSRVSNREQRIYPTISNDNHRKLLEQIQLPPPALYSAEKVLIRQDYQPNLSMSDINKYLERFEKIYNNSSEHQFRESVGSVV